MRPVHLTRKEHFNAAHKLWNEAWSEEKNFEVFGECANPNYHGHNFDLYVTVKGRPDPDTGFVMNVKDLSQLIREKITDKVDHKNLNLDVPFMKGKLASTENLTIAIWDILEGDIRQLGHELYSVKLYETENNIVAYFGEQ